MPTYFFNAGFYTDYIIEPLQLDIYSYYLYDLITKTFSFILDDLIRFIYNIIRIMPLYKWRLSLSTKGGGGLNDEYESV